MNDDDNGVFFELESNTVDDILDEEQRIEMLRRKSYHCLNREQKKRMEDIYKDVGKGTGKKLMLIVLSSLIAYYGLFTIIIPELIYQIGIDEWIVYIISITILIVVVVCMFWYIHKGDFGKTQFFVYLVIYTFLSTIGLMVFFSDNFPITSYQIINTFFYILIIQVVVMYFSVYFTRGLVCRV